MLCSLPRIYVWIWLKSDCFTNKLFKFSLSLSLSPFPCPNWISCVYLSVRNPCSCYFANSKNNNNKTKKHKNPTTDWPIVMAYMEMFGNCSHTTHNNSNEFVRHSVHTCNLNHHSSSVDQFTSADCQQQQQLQQQHHHQQSSRYISHSQTMR